MNYLIIGDQCVDVFIYGEVKRLSPEAPIPIFTPLRKVENGGMAKNVYANLFSMITPHKLCSLVGHFSNTNTKKTRYVEEKSNHYFIRIDENDNSNRIDINKYLKKQINDADCIIISDYDKGFITEADISLIYENKKQDAVVFLDTKKAITYLIMESIDFIKLNEPEYEKNKKVVDSERYYNKVIITKGSEGAFYNGQHFPTEKKLTIDVSGAGDTFLASLAYNYMLSKNIEIAIVKANKSACEVVSKRGVSVI